MEEKEITCTKRNMVNNIVSYGNSEEVFKDEDIFQKMERGIRFFITLNGEKIVLEKNDFKDKLEKNFNINTKIRQEIRQYLLNLPTCKQD